MGGIESRFNALLVEGKSEGEALQMWHENTELQSRYRLNAPVKSSPDRDTPLNLVTRAEMTALLKEFLARGADPLCPNAKGLTSLHVACVSARCGSRTGQRRAEILKLLLDKAVERCGKARHHAVPPSELNSSASSSGLWRILTDPRDWLWGSASEERTSGGDREFDLGIQDKVIYTVHWVDAWCKEP